MRQIVRRKSRSITIEDVARSAGVGVSTVSRVLNEKDDVAPETYEKVQEVIRSLGYASSLAAISMRSRRTHMLGLIMPDVTTPYSIEVMRGVNRTIAQLDYNLIIFTTGDYKKHGTAEEERKYVALINGNIVDGVIVVTPIAKNFTMDAPLVAIDPNNESPDCTGIIATNREGALEAMDYLTRLGHRRIGFIAGRPDLVSACQRLQGYKDGLAAAGIPFDDELVQTGDFTTETAMARGRTLLSLKNPPTAIFAANDSSAIGVYQAALEAGLRIPEDVSIVGFDNLRESACLNPPLTTVDQFIEKMGTVATEMIVKLVEGQSLPIDPAMEGNLYKVPTRLVIRDSCTFAP